MKNFINDKTYKELEKKAQRIIKENNKQGAKVLASEIAKSFDKNFSPLGKNPILSNQYNKLIVKLRSFGGPPYEVAFDKEYDFEITDKNLSNEEIYKKIEKVCKNIINHQRQEEARQFNIKLEKEIAKTGSEELKEKYKKLIIGLKLTSIAAQPIEQIQNIIKNYFLYLKDFEDINIFNRIRIFLLGTPQSVRDNYKKLLRQSLAQSQQTISQEKIKINNEIQKPTVNNWIKDYTEFLGVGMHSFIQRSNYLFQSKNCQKLAQKEKEKLNLVLQFYDLMSISTWKVGAIDNPSVETFSIPMRIYGAKQPQYSEAKVPQVAPNIMFSKALVATPDDQQAIKIRKESEEISNKIKQEEKEFSKKKEPLFLLKLKNQKEKIIKAVPKKEVLKPIKEPKSQPKPTPAKEYLEAKKETLPQPMPKIEPEIPLKTFHKEKQQITQPAKPVSKELNKIQNITLDDFKNLGQSAKQCAQALLTKIREVAKTHDERTVARENFIKSPLYKLYEAMTNQSESEKKSISQIAEDRQKQGTEYLTEDQYIAVKSVSKLI